MTRPMTQPAPKNPATRPIPAWLMRGLGTALVVAITLAIFLNREHLQHLKTLGYLGAFLAMLLSNATLILPAPGLIIVFALGSSLNPVLVGLAGATGAALGEITGYMLGANGVHLMDKTAVAQRIERWMQRNGALTIFSLSIFPNPFFDMAGVLAGAGHIPLWRFLTVTFAGKSIQSIIIALAGALSLSWIEPWLTH
ncbi:MAG: VTT domain-containing protein [Anaerolineae bacterium]|nr:VTT domain-containing protein [Anaerolineae bacterium]